jgi:gliding motility-associatede transport system auxiliary component
MAGTWLRARQTKYVAYATVYILVVVTIAIVVNVLANRYNRSWDSTANKRYTLSDQTMKIVKGLKQDVQIKYYDQTSRFPAGRDLLDRYSNLSSRVRVQYIDPDRNPQVARAAGITSYGTTVVEVGDRKQQAKDLTEEGVTGALITALKNTVRTVCFVTGSGEHRIDDLERTGFSKFKDLLSQDSYTSKSISLLQQPDIPSDCTVVIVGGPTSDYQSNAVASIQKYVESGGRAMFLLDPPLKLGKPTIADNDALTKLLASWGVTLDKDLIVDLNPLGQLAGVGPQVALVSKYEYQPIVNSLNGTATGFPLARSMQTKNMDKTAVQQLFSSSDTSLATENLASASFNARDPNNKKGPLPLAAAGTYSTDKTGEEGRFVVVGNSEWAANSFIDFNGNRDLAMNAVNWLSSDEDLISIRPKPPEDREINMTTNQLRWVQISSQFLMPLVVVLAGVTVWWRRR